MSTPAAEDVVAAELIAARREGRSLARFSGVVPTSMAEAYQIQELAMSQWQDSLVGWKIGYISADRRTSGDPDRLVGPIWRHQYHQSEEHVSAAEVGIFVSGFAAVVAELVIRLSQSKTRTRSAFCRRSTPPKSGQPLRVPVHGLSGELRSAHGVPIQLPGIDQSDHPTAEQREHRIGMHSSRRQATLINRTS
jgi:hypothetical protein